MPKYLIAVSESQLEEMYPINEIVKLKAGDQYFCFVRTNRSSVAFEHQCPHQAHSLTLGRINSQNQVVCPLHDYSFDLKHGDEDSFRCRSLRRYDLVWDGGKLYVVI